VPAPREAEALSQPRVIERPARLSPRRKTLRSKPHLRSTRNRTVKGSSSLTNSGLCCRKRGGAGPVDEPVHHDRPANVAPCVLEMHYLSPSRARRAARSSFGDFGSEGHEFWSRTENRLRASRDGSSADGKALCHRGDGAWPLYKAWRTTERESPLWCGLVHNNRRN